VPCLQKALGLICTTQVMDFEPGEFLIVKEVHYNQHGLLLLEGQGIYRLADQWHPVTAGDAVWMSPFVVQWYGALGKTRSRYIINKDCNRGAAHSPLDVANGSAHFFSPSSVADPLQ
jgi:glyoxylate utilization-related uncharacterized protein